MGRIMRRRLPLAASLLGAILACSGSARAGGAWLASGSLTPVEQRVAVAVGPTRTTLWTSLRFDAGGGTVALLVPAPVGSALDISSDAWFEALEVATAPRIFPPANVSPFCPGKSGSPSLFQLDGETSHTPSLSPQHVDVLADAPAVNAWAAQADLKISPALLESLNSLTGVQFVAVQFTAPPGSSVMPTLRVVMPSAPPVLPLALTRAAGTDLRVTAWIVGQGEADLVNGNQVAIPLKSLAWKAAAGASNYDAVRAEALAPGADTFLVESASHGALVDNTTIGGGTAFIDGVVTTFFERAAAYGDGAFDSASCVATTTPLLSSTMTVAASCPPGALGFIEPAPTCTESPAPGQVDPQGLRCGPGADDLAIALSSLAPASVWVTRQSLLIPNGYGGVDSLLGFSGGATMSPVLDAQSVDVSKCGNTSTGSGASSGTSTGSGSGSGSGSSGSASTGSGKPGGGTIDFGGVDLSVDEPADTSCSCDDTSATSADSTSTDESSSSCDSSSPSSSGCSGSSSSDGGSSDSGSSGCSGSDSGSSGCSGSGSSSGGDCSGGSSGGGAGCSGGGGGGGDFNCSILGARRVRAPRLSIVLMISLAVVAPLRRRGRRRRARPGVPG